MPDESVSHRSERDRVFDNDAFFAALDAERVSRGMHWKAVAGEARVSASTLTRIGQGRRPDVESFAALTSWAGLDPERFFRSPSEPSQPSALSGISILLRSDPQLSTDAATAIEELVKATYVRLRREP
ncbi:helix-turn-helix domain-containing protein [Conexibacter sp. DBS9H8]|uniref:helix-turn-helix domain-containing protein n=1 Tax=Conexibacter sp. DBS9H8 TaxID=2937801 RepID=UPI00200ED46A|nr:helix-turn-helix domain-containing protein [Conexibacter sp. DBS9H8]